MDLFSQKIERSELKEGDHIYSWRKQLYSHHGIYIGKGKIIHFVNPNRDSEVGVRGTGHFLASIGFSTSSSIGEKKNKTPCSTSFCGNEKVPGSGVRSSCIDCFLKKGKLRRFKYEASREFLLAKTVAGTCTTAKSDTPGEVIHRAVYLHENGYGKYDRMDNNCEDFALYCKTGLWSTDKERQGRSSQANMVRRSKKKDVEMGGRVVRYATAVPRSFSKRENGDLGVRTDVVKVPVEELSFFAAL